jgi:glycosyltransferase involved in cell wall biosynthesis
MPAEDGLLITVVMVTRDAAPVIDDALASLAQQRGAALELVVVDGGSTDDTLARVAAQGVLAPRVLTGPDAGIYDAMNKGVAAARGDALFFLNADDRLAHPDALADLASALQQSGADLVFGDTLTIGPAGDHHRSHHRVTPCSLGYEPLSHQAVLARRRVFDVIGGFDTRWAVCADLDWLLRSGRAGLRWQHLPRLVCRCLAGGFSQRHFAQQMAEVRTLRRQQRSPLAQAHQHLAAALHRRLAGFGAPQAAAPPPLAWPRSATPPA